MVIPRAIIGEKGLKNQVAGRRALREHEGTDLGFVVLLSLNVNRSFNFELYFIIFIRENIFQSSSNEVMSLKIVINLVYY